MECCTLLRTAFSELFGPPLLFAALVFAEAHIGHQRVQEALEFVYIGEIYIGRPSGRWEDGLWAFGRSIGLDWEEIAQRRETWAELEDQFVQFDIQGSISTGE